MVWLTRTIKFFNNAVTDEKGALCAARSIGIVAGCEMLYKFLVSTTPDYIGFSSGIAAIIFGIAMKDYVERRTMQYMHTTYTPESELMQNDAPIER